jgi:phosphate uptake regulator
MEDVRSVQMTGGSTFTVSLPKDWAERSGIGKGSRIVMSEKEDGSISIYPLDNRPSDKRQKVISLDDDLSLLSRKVIASYIMGFDSITIRSDRFSSEHRTHIFNLVEGLMGLEVIREDSQSIEIKQMLDPTQLTIPSALSRLYLLAESMIRDLPAALSESNRTLLSDIATRESHVDRIHWFLLRQINYGIIDHRFSHSVDLDIHLATCYLSVARNVERICDHVENVANLMLDISKSSSLPNSLVEISNLCSDIFSRSMRSFLKSDIGMAQEVLIEVDRQIEDYAISTFTDITRRKKRSHVLNAMLAAESLHRIISYSQDIAEITVDSVISH